MMAGIKIVVNGGRGCWAIRPHLLGPRCTRGWDIQSAPVHGPSDDSCCPSTSVGELAAPVFPRRVSLVSLTGPVDAPALPHVSVEELVAPGVPDFLNSCPKVSTLGVKVLPVVMTPALVGPNAQFRVSQSRFESGIVVGEADL